MLVSSPSNLLNSSWTCLDIVVRILKPLSVESVSSLSLSKYSSSSLVIYSNINVLSVFDSVFISSKPKRFDVTLVFSTNMLFLPCYNGYLMIFRGFSIFFKVIFFSFYLKNVFFCLRMVGFFYQQLKCLFKVIAINTSVIQSSINKCWVFVFSCFYLLKQMAVVCTVFSCFYSHFLPCLSLLL